MVDCPGDTLDFCTEFPIEMKPSGLPPFELQLKQGCIAMLLGSHGTYETVSATKRACLSQEAIAGLFFVNSPPVTEKVSQLSFQKLIVTMHIEHCHSKFDAVNSHYDRVFA